MASRMATGTKEPTRFHLAVNKLISMEHATREALAPVTGTLRAYTEYLTVTTQLRYQMVHMTQQVKEIVARSGVQDGFCYIVPMHNTAAVYLNDNKVGLNRDIARWLEERIPKWPEYQQRNEGEEVADAHTKAVIMHHETTLPVTEGRLDLGTWQKIFYAEFDGERPKRIIVKVIGIAKE